MELSGENQDLQQIREAIGAVIAAPMSHLNTEQLVARTAEIQKLQAAMSGLGASTTAAAVATEPHVTLRKIVQDVSQTCGHAQPKIRKEVKIGVWLVDYPLLTEALNQGRITLEHLRLLKNIDDIVTHHQLIGAQTFFIDQAAALPFTEYEQAVTYWRNAADPDGKEPVIPEAKTGASWHQYPDGSIKGKFFLDPISGAMFTTAVENQAQKIFREDTENGVHRSSWQRTGAAMLNLIEAGVSSTVRAVSPLISIVMGHEIAENLIDRLLDPATPPIEVEHNNIDRRCEFIDGTPLHPNQAIYALIAARFQTIVLDNKNRIIKATVTSRGFPPWMKHLLMIKARGRCQIPGCDSPNPWLQADHVIPHSKGGPTTLDNGQILCDPHNKAKRDG